MHRSRLYGDTDLARALDALSSPVRIAIVRALGEPRSLCEIGISPAADSPRGTVLRGSILSRQTVKMHLDRLAEAGIVTANKVPRDKGHTTEYSLDPESLIAIAEAFQKLAHGLAAAKAEPEPFQGRAVANLAAVRLPSASASPECP